MKYLFIIIRTRIAASLIMLLLLMAVLLNLLPVNHNFLNSQTQYVMAEDDEDEDEDEREDEDEDEDEEDEDEDEDDEDEKEEEYIEYEYVYVGEEIPATMVTQPVTRYISVIDKGYDVDSDGDFLVDALDPNPTVDERLLFTDDDDDGVPNATDAFSGENDFSYIEFEDTNDNGILDAFE